MQTLIEWVVMNKVAIILGLVFLITIAGACTKINHYFEVEDDNVIEEDVERLIKDETRWDVDLTPDSKESIPKVKEEWHE